MDQKPIINVLIIADALTDGDHLINVLRKAGFSLHAEAVRDEDFLRERLASRGWDLLFLFQGNKLISSSRLHDVLTAAHEDLPVLVLHVGNGDSLPEGQHDTGVNDLNDQAQCLLLVKKSRCELHNLETRRELRRTSIAMKELQQRYQVLLDTASDAVGYLHDGLHIYTNQAYTSLFGYQNSAELSSVPFLDLVDEQDVGAVQRFLRDAHSAGETCLFHGITGPDSRTRLTMECASVPYEGERSLQVTLRPATGNVELQKRVRSLRSKDLLTSVNNRSSLEARIETAIADAIYEHHQSALIVIELQGFEEYITLSGRAAGNLVLADAGQILAEVAPADAFIGRCSESEFAVLVQSGNSAANEELLVTLRGALKDGLQTRLPPGVNIGVNAGMATINELSPAADVVMSRAHHNLTIRENLAATAGDIPTDPYNTPEQMFHRVEDAIAKQEFVLVFQPVVSLKEDGVQRYEVRIRLQDDGYMIHPPRFLELANQHGLGEKIDRWVIERSLQMLQERNNPGLQFIINLTHNSIVSPDFLPWLQQKMLKTRQAADRFVLQISELDIVSSPQQVTQFCQQLQQLRIALSVTHFGCTLTPFKYLPHESAAYVKLDKSLLDDIGLNLGQRDKLNNTVNALHAQGLLVIAPMIDQINLLPLLWQANVNFVQGNFLQEPTDKLDFSFVQDEELTLDSFR